MTITAPDPGDCPGLTGDGGILSQLQISPAQRMACEMACTSSSDKTALTNLINCLNNIRGQVGPCSVDAGEGWLTQVAGYAIACFNGTNNMPSAGCIAAVTGMSDAG
jgi:hypothetical protein